LLLVGERDDADSQAAVDLLETKIEGAKKVIVPDAGHLSQLEMPNQFNRLVLEFLNEQGLH
jgi:pimeloyl-ACP methyl ester carboxylesterase